MLVHPVRRRPRLAAARSACMALVASMLAAAAPAMAQQPGGAFVSEVLHTAPYEPRNGITGIVFDHEGAVLTIEKQGRVMRAVPNGSGGFENPVEFANFVGQVRTNAEAGLLGIALDPAYATNRHLYLFYTTDADQRLVRITANEGFTAMQGGSATVLLSGLPRDADIHKGGDIAFSPSDPNAIYIALGDDGERNRIACPSRDNLQIAIPQCPDRYEGKFLKVDAGTGLGLSSNPFYDGDVASIPSRVWAVGFRNPFRFAFHRSAPSADVIYVSENGDGIDRISRVRVGSNGGWGPCGDTGACNGANDANDGGPFVSPKDPNHKVLRTSNPSVVGIDIAPAGPFGADVLYFGRWNAPITRGQLTGSAFDVLEPLDGGGTFFGNASAVTLKFGPDGHMYYASTGQGASTNGFDPLRRLRFNATVPPTASFTTSPDPATGFAPLQVQFTDTSTAPGSSIASRAWTFGDGASSGATNPIHTYTEPGTYNASLTVTNSAGQQASTSRQVHATRGVTLQIDGLLRDARTLAAPALGVSTQVRVYQIDGTTPVPFAGALAPGNAFAVPAGGVVDADIVVDLVGDGVVLSVGEPAGDGVQPVRLGYVLPSGDGPHALVLDAWLSDTAVAGRVVDTRGAPLAVDVGLRRDGAPYALPNGRDYLPGTLPATGVAHRVTSDALGYYHFALRSADGGNLRLDAVGDTGTATHGNPLLQRTLDAGALASVDITVGLWHGGSDCANLDAIAVTPDVDFDVEIQGIFDSLCQGCHAPNVTNSGGLDLTRDNSYAALVNAPSGRAPGVPRVRPGDEMRSFLFEKINCAQPQIGTQMRPADPLPLVQQALIRDWIRQIDGRVEVFADGFEE